MGVTATVLEKLVCLGSALAAAVMLSCCTCQYWYKVTMNYMHFVRSKVCTIDKLQSKCILSKFQKDGLACHAPSGKETVIMSHRAGLKPGVVLHRGGAPSVMCGGGVSCVIQAMNSRDCFCPLPTSPGCL